MKYSSLFYQQVTVLILILGSSSGRPQQDGSSNNDPQATTTTANIVEDKTESTTTGAGINFNSEEITTFFVPSPVTEKPPKKEENPIIDAVGGILEGIFGFVTDATNVITDLASNENVGDAIDTAVEIGTNATKMVAEVGSEIAEEAPNIIGNGSNFIDGFSRTAGETSFLVNQAVEEYNGHAKLFASFMKTYTDLALKDFTKFMEIFNLRLKCNTDCRKMEENSLKRQQCEAKYCKDLKEEIKDEKDEEYDYLSWESTS